MKGRKPTPETVRHRAGLNPPITPPPECPDWLDGDAKQEWVRIMPSLILHRIVSEVDGMTLAAYCQAYSQWKSAELVLRAEGMVILTPRGEQKMHPLAGHVVKLLSEIRRLAEQFGFTPVSRQRIDTEPSGEDHDDFDDFENGANQERRDSGGPGMLVQPGEGGPGPVLHGEVSPPF